MRAVRGAAWSFALRLTNQRVARPVVALVDDGAGEQVATRLTLQVALARCRRCGGRFRVLPADVLPHKQYGLAVIVALTEAHVEGNAPLRPAVWSTHIGQTPAHSTLHAWTEGMGAFVLGRRFGEVQKAHPYQATMAITAARWSALASAVPAASPIDPARHRSDARRERLVAVAELLARARIVGVAAGLATSHTTPALFAWRRYVIEFGVPAPLTFRTGLLCTPSEHGAAHDRESCGLPESIGAAKCQIRTRSPPSASSRSLPSSIPPSALPNDGV